MSEKEWTATVNLIDDIYAIEKAWLKRDRKGDPPNPFFNKSISTKRIIRLRKLRNDRNRGK